MTINEVVAARSAPFERSAFGFGSAARALGGTVLLRGEIGGGVGSLATTAAAAKTSEAAATGAGEAGRRGAATFAPVAPLGFLAAALRLPRGAEESLVTRFLTDRPLASRSCFRHNSPVRAGEASQYFGGASADHPFEFAVFD